MPCVVTSYFVKLVARVWNHICSHAFDSLDVFYCAVYGDPYRHVACWAWLTSKATFNNNNNNNLIIISFFLKGALYKISILLQVMWVPVFASVDIATRQKKLLIKLRAIRIMLGSLCTGIEKYYVGVPVCVPQDAQGAQHNTYCVRALPQKTHKNTRAYKSIFIHYN